MKKLILIILIALAFSGKGNETYLFTDTKTDLTGISIHDPVTWIFSKDNTLLTLKTEMQDVTYNITRVQTIESITGNYTKYSLDNGSAVYVHSETLEVIFCTESNQYIFAPADDKYFTSKIN